MRVPVSWLRELVDVDVATDVLAERLALAGVGVERIERMGEDVSGIYVGDVLSVRDVEVSEKLCVAEVDAGPRGRYQIVAGAKNFSVGDRVPVALPGARVTTLDVPISVRPMPGGLESQGMLCSAKELGVSDDHGGILVLGPDAPVGADVPEMLGLRDEILELEITPNRPDLLSVFGVAREVAVLFGGSVRPEAASHQADGPDVATLTRVDIEAPEGCPRYLAMVVEGVVYDQSPLAVQRRIAACGMRPLGNLVDATNYVLLLTGQPLHAFDLDRLVEERIVVRWARAGERMATLDGVDRDLAPDDLVIADASAPQALAGVMGGASSEVSSTTSRVLIESAHFTPAVIARTARRHGLVTEASRRFERGADPGAVPGAAALCAELMRLWAQGTVAQGQVDVGSVPPRETITLRRARADALIGIGVEAAETDRLLAGLGCDVRPHEDRAEVLPPSWRPDLTREIDLIEEIARLHGYDAVPMRVPTGARGFLTPAQTLRRRVRDVLLGAGLTEVVLTSFVSDDDLAASGERGEPLRVSNPLSVDQEALRPSLIPGMLRWGQRNTARGLRDLAAYEIGQVFSAWADADSPLPPESLRLGLLVAGDASSGAWHETARPADELDVKGILEVLLAELGVTAWTTGPCDEMPLHPGRSATISLDGAVVGRFGALRPSVARAFDLEGTPAVAEIELEPLIAAAPAALSVVDLPRMPAVRRDITFVLDEHVPSAAVEATIRAAAGPALERVALRDVYTGEPVPSGSRALTYRIVLRAADRTLTDAEADEVRATVAEAVRTLHAAQLR
ncbi:MAG TPA: phenylalanine--tRNA ligase subunit beta [Actinomycetota bacterium]|nr:phenylalanine--tRNA ligase subunit beta [Actinomycetota bacterium]